MSQKQNDNWHIDFASKVQEKSDRKKAISSSGTSGSKTSNDDEDDPLTKTFRRRDLRRELAQARGRIANPNERIPPKVGPDGRRRPKRAPPPKKPPPPQQSPMSDSHEFGGDFGSKVNSDNRSRTGGGSVRPPPNNPFRPPRGKPPPPNSPNRYNNNSNNNSSNDKYDDNKNNDGRRRVDPNKLKRRPPPRGKIPRPRGINSNNPRSVDNSGGASTSQLIAFATRHQAQIQKQQTHYIRKPPSGQPPRRKTATSRNPNVKPPVPKGSPLPKHKNNNKNPRRPPRAGNNPNSKKPPPPNGPPPKSAIEAGVRARSRQNPSNLFELGPNTVYISDDDDDTDSDSEEYKKKKLRRQQGQAQMRRRPPGHKKMNPNRNDNNNDNKKDRNKHYGPRGDSQSDHSGNESRHRNHRNDESSTVGKKTSDMSDSDTDGDDDTFYDVEEEDKRVDATKNVVVEKKKKGRPKLSIQVADSNKATPRKSKKIPIDEGKVSNNTAVVDEGKSPDNAVVKRKKKKKRPNLTVMVTDSNHEAEDSSNNNTADNPFSGVGNLQINVDDGTQNFNETYHLSNSGAFNAEGFVIRETGIAKAPKDGKDSSRTDWYNEEDDGSGYGKNIRAEMLKLCVLGRGAGGIVYKSLHMPTMRIVAVKNIPVYESDKRHQMVRELKALYQNLVPISGDGSTTARGGIKLGPCPQIVSFHDAFINPDEGNISIVLEYMDGGSLQDIVDTGGCPQESVLANVSYRVLVALAFIHDKHQIHRDIKPSNLLINHNGEVKVSDFGIVREMESTVAKANTFVGTLTYMSPERISGEAYSYASDLWSFGLSILAVALGKYPLNTEGGYWGLLHNLRDEPSPKLPEDEFSPDFCEFINLCLHKDPNERPTCRELLDHPFLEGCAVAMEDQTRTIRENMQAVLEGFDDENGEDEDMISQGSDTARTELDELCELSMNRLYDLWSKGKAKQEEEDNNGEGKRSGSTVPSQFPRITRLKLANLSFQLGLSVNAVVRCFERKWRELTGAGHETARRASRVKLKPGEPDMLRVLVAEGGRKK